MIQLHLVPITGEVVYNKFMDLGLKLKEANRLLDNASNREDTRTRRKRILRFLYNERYLTWKGISLRLELVSESFLSWWDGNLIAFILDMWFVRKAFFKIGYQLAYSLMGERQGFYLRGERELSPEMHRAIQGAVAEIDPRQVEITRRLTPAQRVQEGLSLTNLAHIVVRYRNEMRKRE